MIQLENTEKGYKMKEYTPEQLAQNKIICELPIIDEIKKSESEIIEDLEGLKQGQEEINIKVDNGFSKSKDRMDGLETMFKNHIESTKENHKEAMKTLADLKTEIKDNKLKDLSQDLAKKNEEIAVIKSRVMIGVKMVANTILSILAGGAIVYLFSGPGA